MLKRANILVIGAGAVGGIVAALLKKSNYNVSLVTKYQDLANLSNTRGLHIFGQCGNHFVKVPAVAKIIDIKVQPDYVFIATKAAEMPGVVKKILPFLHEDCRIISLQNGIVEEKLAEIAGVKRTVACTVGWGATMHKRGELEMTSSGKFVIGYLDRPADGRMEEIKAILENIMPVTISEEILSHLYSKLIINSCISSLGAICGLTVGQMLIREKVRNIFLDIITEAIQVADAMNLRVLPYAGKLDYYKLLKWSRIRQRLFLVLFGSKYRKLKSSSLQSLLRGGKTEVNYFNGYIEQKGVETGISTPINSLVTKMILEIEEKKRKITPENFSDPGFL